MNGRVLRLLLASFVLLALAIPASAHHSFAAAFDKDKPVTIKGVLTEIRLENPHSWFFIEVREGGKVEKWAFEAGTPSGMIRNGFKPNTIKTGTEVTVKAIRARDASQNMGLLQEIVTPDGKTYATFGTQGDR
jgi:uncharacterized protein DUF6152